MSKEYDLEIKFSNSPLLIVFKLTLTYEICICILPHQFDQLDNVFQMECCVLSSFVYLTQKVAEWTSRDDWSI